MHQGRSPQPQRGRRGERRLSPSSWVSTEAGACMSPRLTPIGARSSPFRHGVDMSACLNVLKPNETHRAVSANVYLLVASDPGTEVLGGPSVDSPMRLRNSEYPVIA